MEFFHKFSHVVSNIVGSAWAFFLAALVVVVWVVTGPVFGFSDTWQLVINTGTTIVTFLMVFLIQNTQNRDAHAIHLKLDEILRAVRGARNSFIDLEDESDERLKNLGEAFKSLAEHEREPHGIRGSSEEEKAARRDEAIRKAEEKGASGENEQEKEKGRAT